MPHSIGLERVAATALERKPAKMEKTLAITSTMR